MSEKKLPYLKNIILFDDSEDIHIALATQVRLSIYQFSDMVREGLKSSDVKREEPKLDSVLILGTTSGTTGEPK